jgi:hypothetical protein
MVKLKYDAWIKDALKQLQEIGVLARYKGEYDIVDLRGEAYILIKDDKETVGLLDLLYSWNRGALTRED